MIRLALAIIAACALSVLACAALIDNTARDVAACLQKAGW